MMLTTPILLDYQSSTPCLEDVVNSMAPYWSEILGVKGEQAVHLVRRESPGLNPGGAFDTGELEIRRG